MLPTSTGCSAIQFAALLIPLLIHEKKPYFFFSCCSFFMICFSSSISTVLRLLSTSLPPHSAAFTPPVSLALPFSHQSPLSVCLALPVDSLFQIQAHRCFLYKSFWVSLWIRNLVRFSLLLAPPISKQACSRWENPQLSWAHSMLSRTSPEALWNQVLVGPILRVCLRSLHGHCWHAVLHSTVAPSRDVLSFSWVFPLSCFEWGISGSFSSSLALFFVSYSSSSFLTLASVSFFFRSLFFFLSFSSF